MPYHLSEVRIANTYWTQYKILEPTRQTAIPEEENWQQRNIAIAAGFGQPDGLGRILYRDVKKKISERPLAFSSVEKQWSFDVRVSGLEPEYYGKSVELSMWDSNTYAMSWCKFDSPLAQGSQVVSPNGTATIQITGDGTSPMGFFGWYKFSILKPDGTSSSFEPILLEAYYLSVPNLPTFFDNGIPLLFLRMFLLPQRCSVPDRTVETWVRNVTEICFGSRMPFDGSPSNTEKHWLIYNTTGAGAPSFTSGYGKLGLNLDAWLDAYRNWKRHNVYTRVNCFDQAAIAEVALCLGVPHQQIHWEYHQVYGFISTGLVGWGKINNPYFDDIKTKRWYEDPKDPKREPFRNHAYLSWSKSPVSSKFHDDYNELMKDNTPDHAAYVKKARAFEHEHQGKLYMIDACGGPRVGTETREEYEAQVESIPDLASCSSQSIRETYRSKGGKEHYAEEHYLGAGVSDQPSFNLVPTSKKNDYDKAIKHFVALTTPKDTLYVKVQPNIKTLQKVFQEHVDKWMRPRWRNYREYDILPFTTPNGTIVHETKINFSYGANIRLDRAASMRIAVSDKPDGAQQALAEHLAFKYLSVENPNSDLKRRSSVYELVKRNKTIAVVGTYYIRAFVWQNVAVEITVEHDAEWEECDNAVLNKVFLSLVEM